jgi:hypothetical protein
MGNILLDYYVMQCNGLEDGNNSIETLATIVPSTDKKFYNINKKKSFTTLATAANVIKQCRGKLPL